MFQILLDEKAAPNSNVVNVVDTFTRRRQRRANRVAARKLAA